MMRFLLLVLCFSSGLSARAGYIIETVIQLDGTTSANPVVALNHATLRHTVEVTDSIGLLEPIPGSV